MSDNVKTNGQKTELDPMFSAPTIQREYTKVEADISGGLSDVEEQHINRPKIDFNSSDSPDEIEAASIVNEAFEGGSTESPGLSEADSKTKREAAKYLADTAIEAYVQLNNVGKNLVSFSEEKMKMKAFEGKFDMDVLSVELPMSDGPDSETITVKEFIDGLNESTEEIFEVSEDIKERARPLLIEIFKEKGWGMTPTQQLFSILLEDAIPKVTAIVAITKNTKQILDIASALLHEKRENGAPEKEEDTLTTEDVKKDTTEEEPTIKRKPGRPPKKKKQEGDVQVIKMEEFREPGE